MDELRAEVEAGAIDTVITAFTDMQGRLMGKREHAEFFLEESAVHGIGRHGAATLHGTPVVPVLPLQAGPPTVPPQRWANVLSDLFLQKPQNTFG